MSDKKQTAVQWLYDELSHCLHREEVCDLVYKLEQKALQMEQEQIEKSYTSGREQWQKYEWDNSNHENDVEVPTPRKYYKAIYGEKFGKNYGGQDESNH
jgi:hypothetical protein